jgi:pyruvate dehydrogenase (quinone)
MRAQAGDPKFEASQDLPDFRYSQYAEQLGFKGIFVDRPDQVAKAWADPSRLIGQLCSRP